MWTEKRLAELKRQGKIKGYQIPEKKGNGIQIPKRSREKEWLSWNLSYWANEHALTLETEFMFHLYRKWRFDWCLPGLKVGIEFEGIMAEKSRHTSVVGYSSDTTKYREASKDGWIVLRYTVINYRQVLKDLNEIFQKKTS